MRTSLLRTSLFLLGVLLSSAGLADDKDELGKLAKDLKAKDAKTRLKAVEGIEALGEKAAPISRQLCDALMDRDVRVAKASLLALEKVNPKVHKNISRLLLNREQDQLETVRDVMKMGKEASPAINVIIAKLTPYLDSVGSAGQRDTIARLFAEGLQDIDAEDESVVKFYKGLAATEPTKYWHDTGIKFMVKWAGEDKDKRKTVYPYLKAAFTKSMNKYKYLEALGDYGSLSKELLPAIKQLRFDSVELTRKLAAEAATKIEEAIKP